MATVSTVAFIYHDGILRRTPNWAAVSPYWANITPAGCGEVCSFMVHNNRGAIIDSNGDFYYSRNIQDDVPVWEKV